MTLKNLLDNITYIANGEVLVHSVGYGASIYKLNGTTVNDYPLFFASPTGTHSWDFRFTRYRITLFYLDRLLEDSTNEDDVHSTGMDELKNILKKISEEPWCAGIETADFQLFTETERLSDRCSGAYVNITLKVADDYTCYE